MIKTQMPSSGDVIWSGNVDLLLEEDCLPVIGSCQVSSILSDLDSTGNKSELILDMPQSADLITLHPSDLRLPHLVPAPPDVNLHGPLSISDLRIPTLVQAPANPVQFVQQDLVDLSSTSFNERKTTQHTNHSNNEIKKNSRSKPVQAPNNFESILYFVCDMCPFLCIKKSKIAEHMENAHKSKMITKKPPQLKCPACPNEFFHKMSLKSHLIHDHGVRNSDIKPIVQAVVSLANKLKADETKHKTLETPPAPRITNTHTVAEDKDNHVKPSANFGPTRPDPPAIETPPSLVLPAPVPSPPKPQITHSSITERIMNAVLPTKSPDTTKRNAVTKLIGTRFVHRCRVSKCKAQFQDATNLSYHTKCHKDQGFVCQVCSETFTYWKTLATHLWRSHSVDMELYGCDKCNYKCVSLAKLNQLHKPVHSDLKEFACDLCEKAFKNRKLLGNHKARHKKGPERFKYGCDSCDKMFSDRRQMMLHVDRVHKNIKPFLCNFCGYKASSRSSLKMHIRQHTGEKPFACTVCSYTTSDHNSLRRHRLRHTGEKPYKCSYCSYESIQSSTYKIHLKTKHPGQEKDFMFSCTKCQFKSVKKDVYVLHMVTVHDQKPPS